MTSNEVGKEAHDETSIASPCHTANASESTTRRNSDFDLEKNLASVQGSSSNTLNLSEKDVPTACPTGTTDDDTMQETSYPEGGSEAWLVVLGSFCGMLASFGLMNSVGTFQTYISTHQLSNLSPSTIGWISSIYIFLSFGCGLQIGPIFDAKGPKWLLIAGGICLVVGMIGVGESTSMFSISLSFLHLPVLWLIVS